MRVAARITVTGGTIEGQFLSEELKPFFLDVAQGGTKTHQLHKTGGGRQSLVLVDAACVTTLEVWNVSNEESPDFSAWGQPPVEAAPPPTPPPESKLRGTPPRDPGPQAIDLKFLEL